MLVFGDSAKFGDDPCMHSFTVFGPHAERMSRGAVVKLVSVQEGAAGPHTGARGACGLVGRPAGRTQPAGPDRRTRREQQRAAGAAE